MGEAGSSIPELATSGAYVRPKPPSGLLLLVGWPGGGKGSEGSGCDVLGMSIIED